MPIDVGETINSIGDAFLRAPVMGTIARSPIYTGLLITFVLVLIVMFTFRDVDSEESLLVLCLRCGFWTFLFLTGILFLHNKVLARDYSAGDRESIYGGMFADDGRTNVYSGDRVTGPAQGESGAYIGDSAPRGDRGASMPIAGPDGIAYIPVRTVSAPIASAPPQ